MTTLLEEFVSKFGWQVDKSGFAQVQKQSLSVGKAVGKLAGLYTAIGGIITGVIAKTNANTAAQYRLSQSLGVSYDWLKRWGEGTKALGVGAEGVSKAVSYLQRNLGNVKINPAQAGQVKSALNAIGLSFEQLKGKSTQDQFDTIANAIDGTSDKALKFAVSAKIFGRAGGAEFAKLSQLARANGKTLQEYIGRFKDLEFQTEESVKGAVRFNSAFSRGKFAIEEMKAAIAGYVGDAIAPLMEAMLKWVSANRELLKAKIKEWAQSLAHWLRSLYNWLAALVKVLRPVVNALGGLGGALKALALVYMISKVNALAKSFGGLAGSIGNATTGIMGVGGKGGLLGALTAIAAIALDDLRQSMEDISNNSWGNRIARWGLRTKDKAEIWWEENIKGQRFKNDAERENWLAAHGWKKPGGTFLDSDLPQTKEAAEKRSRDARQRVRDAEAAKRGRRAGERARVQSAKARKAIEQGEIWTPTERGDLPGGPTYSAAQRKRALDKLNKLKQRQTKPTAAPSTGTPRQLRLNTPGGKQVVVNAPITVNAAPGMNEQQIGKVVKKHVEKITNKAVQDASLGAGQEY